MSIIPLEHNARVIHEQSERGRVLCEQTMKWCSETERTPTKWEDEQSGQTAEESEWRLMEKNRMFFDSS